MLTSMIVRRSADDVVKIEKAYWEVLKDKMNKQAEDCIRSNGRVVYYPESVDCKKN